MIALNVSVTGDATERRLVLQGRLDEAAPLVKHVPTWTARTVVIDSSEITFINSIGIREWMHFIAALTAAGAAVVHERCSEPLVEQMCFIPAVRGDGEVRSFHAPYACAACGHEQSVLIDVARHRAQLIRLEAPPATCRACGQPLALADVPERWFAFLR
ncbi:MAG: hypothetical protein JNK64_36610 [Myxococcales bacterium]|nr:hypothetical protein [Myxococcales bacterium]